MKTAKPTDGNKYFKNKKKRNTDVNYFSDVSGSDVMLIEDCGELESGKIYRNYKEVKGGIKIDETFISKNKYKRLDEKLSKEDEKEVKELIKKQLKYMLWQLYTKQGIFVGNI